MTDSDVGATAGTTLALHLDRVRAEALRRWATIGRRDLEETVIAAIDEYLMPVEIEAHRNDPQADNRRPGMP